MKLLILGDVVGTPGRDALKKKLPRIINENNIDFVVVNGENAADDGRGLTQSIAEEFFLNGVDVVTSGNHIWDKQESVNYIDKENKIITSPAYMLGKSISDVAEGIEKTIRELLAMI